MNYNQITRKQTNNTLESNIPISLSIFTKMSSGLIHLKPLFEQCP